MKAIKAKNKLLAPVVVAMIFILLIIAVLYGKWENKYRGRIYPDTWIGTLNLSGLSLDGARQIITEKTSQIEANGITFNYNGQTAILSLNTISLDADLSASTPIFKPDDILSAALGTERQNSFINYLLTRVNRQKTHEIAAPYSLESETVIAFLKESFPELNIPAENAYFFWDNNKTKTIQINPERVGKEINYEQVLKTLDANLKTLTLSTIDISTQSTYPTVTKTDLEPMIAEAEKLIKQNGLTLRATDLKNSKSQEFLTITPSKLITWLTVHKNEAGATLSLDAEKIQAYLENTIAPKIDREAIRPRFEVNNNKVTSWQVEKSGQKLNLTASAQKIIAEFRNEGSPIDLVIEEVASEALEGEENFRIEEIIGTGYSSFKGSSSNRRENIRVGATALHGLLIKPGEEFSLVATLGDVSDKTGYLPELVIKGDKTVPEYGGGLCQIGTTVFRTALDTGLPITMRQNHSYRVSYYEPAGTDATIYIPWPDLRFLNDTGNYILIQARINGDDLYFDFWGVHDGRTASTTDPVIYNIVKPEPTKIIETEALAPGEKKCTESSHNGADAYFDYTVIYPENSTTTPVHERRFRSHYVPWQAVCLVGKATSTASSTLEIPFASSSPMATSSPDN
jgi:vancomycin resistance protein YoaR